jgi:hypothetical protein
LRKPTPQPAGRIALARALLQARARAGEQGGWGSVSARDLRVVCQGTADVDVRGEHSRAQDVRSRQRPLGQANKEMRQCAALGMMSDETG